MEWVDFIELFILPFVVLGIGSRLIDNAFDSSSQRVRVAVDPFLVEAELEVERMLKERSI